MLKLCFWKAEGAQNAQCDGAQFESQAVGMIEPGAVFFFREIGREGIKFELYIYIWKSTEYWQSYLKNMVWHPYKHHSLAHRHAVNEAAGLYMVITLSN